MNSLIEGANKRPRAKEITPRVYSDKPSKKLCSEGSSLKSTCNFHV
jgi:hypothetical protein